MKDGNDVPQISALLKEKQSIAICLPTQTTLDAAAAALALYHSLQKEGKSVSISSSEPLNPEFALLGQEQVKNTIVADGDVLIVSVPFKNSPVDNVTYNVENDRVNIVIKPEEGAQRFDPKNVEYTFSGGKPDAVVTIYTPTLDSLGELYMRNVDQFQGVSIINIDRHFTNAQYGTINMVDKRSPSMSLMILDLLKEMKLDVSKEIATMLFAGLSSATNNFSSHSVNAQTFKAAALLLERGAEKRPVKPAMPQMGGYKPYTAPGFADFGQQPSMQPSMQQSGAFQQFNQVPDSMDQGFMTPRPLPQQPQQPFPVYETPSGMDDVADDMVSESMAAQGGTAEFKETPLPKPSQQQQQTQQKQKNQQNSGEGKPAQDWLKPQIFNNPQGNSRV